MRLDIKRKTRDGLEIRGNTLGTTIIFQNVTAEDHNNLQDILEDYFDMQSTALYYDWKMVSIFIFDVNKASFIEADWKDLKEDLRNLLPKQKYAVIANGIKDSGSQINQLSITEDKKTKSFTVGRKFELLLDMKLDEEFFAEIDKAADETHDNAE